jgi:hypothetical protein
MGLVLQEHRDHVQVDGGWRASVFAMSNADGEIQVEACDKCDHVEVTCLHTNNTWHDSEGQPIPRHEILSRKGRSGVVLLCNLCGADGT